MILSRSFYLMRHGETDWNKDGRSQGKTDIPLNDIGRAQARDRIPVLRDLPFTKIVTSHLSRARETAEIINAVLQRTLIIDPALSERDLGVCTGRTKDDVARLRLEQPELFAAYADPESYVAKPQGEDVEDFKTRVLSGLSHHVAEGPENDVLFVLHSGVGRVLNYVINGDYTGLHNARVLHAQKTGPVLQLVPLE